MSLMTTQWIRTPSSHAARTDVGRARDHNEDRYLARPPLFVVADGLGGHSAGEVAAQMLVDRLSQLPETSTGEDLVGAIQAADREIRAASQADAASQGMSTTCVALFLRDGHAQVSHVGDSRAYRLRSGVLGRLTDDHSVVGELVRTGIISAADAEIDDRRHMLTQALGSERAASVTTTTIEVQPGDRFMLCSDGLSGQVTERAIEAVMVEHGDPGLAADELVRRANASGGVDNVTVIIVDAQVSVEASPHGSPLPPRNERDPTSAREVRARSGRRRRSLIMAAALVLIAAVGLLAVAGKWILPSGTSDGSPGPTATTSGSPSGSPLPGSGSPAGASPISPSDDVAPPPASVPPATDSVGQKPETSAGS
jgi:protein phosphatase